MPDQCEYNIRTPPHCPSKTNSTQQHRQSRPNAQHHWRSQRFTWSLPPLHGYASHLFWLTDGEAAASAQIPVLWDHL